MQGNGGFDSARNETANKRKFLFDLFDFTDELFRMGRFILLRPRRFPLLEARKTREATLFATDRHHRWSQPAKQCPFRPTCLVGRKPFDLLDKFVRIDALPIADKPAHTSSRL